MGREHLVPLSQQATHIAKSMIAAAPGEFLFPGNGPNKPLSENTMIYALYRLGYGQQKQLRVSLSTKYRRCAANAWAPCFQRRQSRDLTGN